MLFAKVNIRKFCCTKSLSIPPTLIRNDFFFAHYPESLFHTFCIVYVKFPYPILCSDYLLLFLFRCTYENRNNSSDLSEVNVKVDNFDFARALNSYRSVFK